MIWHLPAATKEKSNGPSHQRATHDTLTFSVAVCQTINLSLTDSRRHFHQSGLSSYHILIACDIKNITSVIAWQVIPSQELKLQPKFRSGYCCLEERRPLLLMTWMPASRPPEFYQKLFKKIMFQSSLGLNVHVGASSQQEWEWHWKK